jgi:putative DNA primase/helicase
VPGTNQHGRGETTTYEQRTFTMIAADIGPGNAARLYLAAGLSPIPIRLDGSKAPVRAGWREYSERLPTSAEVERGWGGRAEYGVGIACGPASGCLTVFDFGARQAFDDWAARLDADQRRALANSPVVRTPSNGVHVYTRLTEPVKGTKYARTEDGKCLAETRGSGHQVLAPGNPPPAHATGRLYRFLRTGWVEGGRCERIPLDVFHGLTVLAADLNRYHKPAACEIVGDRPVAGEVGHRPGDKFAARVGWSDILSPHGWRVFRSTEAGTYWTRPGKATGISASTGHCRGPSGDLFYCFSTAAPPFEPERSYSKFGVYAALFHNGDYRAAARALGFAGFGSPRRRKAVAAA